MGNKMNNNFYVIELNTNNFEYQKINIIKIANNYFLMNCSYSKITDVELKKIIEYCDYNNINIEYIKKYVDYFNKDGQPIDYNGEVIGEDESIYIDIDVDGGVYIDMFNISIYQVDFKEFFKTINTNKFDKLLINNKINFKKF